MLLGLVCLTASLDPGLGRGLAACGAGLTGLAVGLTPDVSARLGEVFHRFRFAAIGAGALLALALAHALGVINPDPASIFRAQDHLIALASYATLAISTAAIAGERRRALVMQALLVTPVALAALALFDAFDARHDFFGLSPPEDPARHQSVFANADVAASMWALFLMLGVFGVMDEVRRNAKNAEKIAPVGQRLLLPVLACVSCLNLLWATGALWTLASAGVGCVILVAGMNLRVRRRAAGLMRYALAGLAAFGALFALLAAGGVFDGAIAALSGTDPGDARAAAMGLWSEKPVVGVGLGDYRAANAPEPAHFMAQTGALGLALALTAVATMLAQFTLRTDRNRRPSRALALSAGTVAIVAMQSAYAPVLSAPPVAVLCVMLFGLAGAYLDKARALTPTGRTLDLTKSL